MSPGPHEGTVEKVDEASPTGMSTSALPVNARVAFARIDADHYVVDVMRPDGAPVALVLRRPDTVMIDSIVSALLFRWAEASASIVLRARPARRGVVAVLAAQDRRGPSVRLDVVAVLGLSEPHEELS